MTRTGVRVLGATVLAAVALLAPSGCGGNGGNGDSGGSSVSATDVEAKLEKAGYTSASCKEISKDGAVADWGEGVGTIHGEGDTILKIDVYYVCTVDGGTALAAVTDDGQVIATTRGADGRITGYGTLK